MLPLRTYHIVAAPSTFHADYRLHTHKHIIGLKLQRLNFAEFNYIYTVAIMKLSAIKLPRNLINSSCINFHMHYVPGAGESIQFCALCSLHIQPNRVYSPFCHYRIRCRNERKHLINVNTMNLLRTHTDLLRAHIHCLHSL